MRYLGDYAEDATLHFKFNTIDESGDPITLAGTPSVCVYKADGTTQSAAGTTLTVDFDSVTGLHHVEIDLSADAFYATGNDYQVTIAAGTVDGASVVGVVLADFSIENRFAEVDLQSIDGNAAAAGRLRQVITSWTSGTAQSDSGTTVTLDAGDSSVDDFHKGHLLVVWGGTGAGQARRIIGYTGSTKVATLVNAFTTSLASDSTYLIIPDGTTNVEAISGSKTAADAVEANIAYLDASIATVDGKVDTLVSSILSESDSTDLLQIVADLKNDGRLDVLFDSILEDTGTTLPAAIAAGAVAGGSGSTLRTEVERLAGIDQGTITGSDLLFALEGDETAATWPSAPFKVSTTWYMCYSAKVSDTWRIRMKTSDDGITWTGATDILTAGGSGEWDEGGVWCPHLWVEDGTYLLVYTGYDASGENVSVGYATSSTINSGYAKYGSNPVLSAPPGDFRTGSVECTGVAKFGSTYYLYLTNLPPAGSPSWLRKVWYASGSALASLTQSTTPIFGDSDTSTDRQPGGGYYSASPFKSGTYYYLIVAKYGPYADFSWFEIWESDSATFDKDNIRFVKTILRTQDLATWPDHEVDIIHVATDDIGRDTYSLSSNAMWLYFGAKHNRAGTLTWETGRMVYDSLYELLRPTPAINHAYDGRLPTSRWGLVEDKIDTIDSVVDQVLDDTGTSGVALSTTAVAAIFTQTLTESYAADEAAITPAQALYELLQGLHEFVLSGRSKIIKKRDGSTTAVTKTLNDSSEPTSITKAT
jgi:hypothetical protein